MSRGVSGDLWRVMRAQSSGEVAAFLVTIDHEILTAPFRLSSDRTQRLTEDPITYGTISRGEAYDYLPMEIALPRDETGAPPRVDIKIDNVDRIVSLTLRQITTPPRVTLELILARNPDQVEARVDALALAGFDVTERVITAQLVSEAGLNETFPAGVMSSGRFPGLFA